MPKIRPQSRPRLRAAASVEVSDAALTQALARKDRATIERLADAAHNAHQPELALRALEALEQLGDPRKFLIAKKRGLILLQYGRAQEAIDMLSPLVAHHGDDPQLLRILAGAHYLINEKERAIELLRQVVALAPEWFEAKASLAVWLEETGRREAAEVLLAELIAAQPNDALLRLHWPQVALGRVPSSTAEHDAMLPRFLTHVADVRRWVEGLPQKQRAHLPIPEVCGPFALAYWPGDITPYLRAWGQMMACFAGSAELPTPPERERVRLVLFSRQLYRQSVWLILLRALIRNLDTRFFELVAVSLATNEDDQAAWLKERCARYYGRRPSGWEAILQQEAADVLFFPDTAMDDTSVGYAARRWAPLQVTTWGHPVSSGLTTVDLYFSGELLEPEDAQSHYSERLVRLPGTGACTPNLEFPETPLPEALKALFADGRPVALVPCYTIKLAPAVDPLWVELAQRYPELKLVFFRQKDFGAIGTQSLERIAAALAAAGLDVDRQMVVIDHQPNELFLTLLERATLYLDVPSFSGYTTAWKGVFAGIPIVTLRGRFLRQRLAAGLLTAIGCADTVVDSVDAYIAIVGELIDEWRARPKDYAARRARIRAQAPLACNDVRVVRAFERVLLEELAARGNATAAKLLPQHRAAYPDYHYDRDTGRVSAPPRFAPPTPTPTQSAGPTAQETAMSAPTDPPNTFAPVPVVGLAAPAQAQPAAAPPPTAAQPQPAPSAAALPPSSATAPQPPLKPWQLLDHDLHLHTLSHSYAPVGLLEMITGEPRAVFDLGCFVGGSGRWLKGRFPGVRVVGIELLPAAAEKARAIYDQVYTGRFEALDLTPLAGQFDAIIAADVLDHLNNPWQTLQRLQTLLAPGGALYVSLPNVRNLRVLEGLALGDWPYAGAGILDITHLRFFTRKSALRMLDETGWQVQEVRATISTRNFSRWYKAKTLRPSATSNCNTSCCATCPRATRWSSSRCSGSSARSRKEPKWTRNAI